MAAGEPHDTGTAPSPGALPSSVTRNETKETPPSFGRTLKNRPFFLLWVSQLVSQSGDFIFSVALIWLVLELTRSAFAVGLMVTGMVLPGVLLGPFLGVYIDRWDRRQTLVATNVAEGVVVAVLSALVLLGYESTPELFAIVFLLGTGATVVRVATGAYVPSVVPTGDLPPANSLLSVTGSMNQIVGLSLGGIFVAVLGVGPPIEYDALTFFVAAVLLLFIRPLAAEAAAAPSTPPERRFRQELAEGFAFIRRNRFMVELIVIGVVVNFFGNGLFALFAPYAFSILHGGAATYGFLGAAVAAGSLGGAAAIGRVDLRRTAGRFLFAGGFGIGACILALGWADDVPFALGLMFGLGVALAVTNIPISVVIQAKVPGQLLGRVGSTFSALITLTSPAGPLFAGWLAEKWSISGVFVLSGVVFLVVLGAGVATMRSLRSVSY